MADSPISSLDWVEDLPNGQPNIETDDLFVLEHPINGQKRACKVSGEQVTKFISRNVLQYDAIIVSPTAAGGADYDPETGSLTLQLPRGPGIKRVDAPSNPGQPGSTDTYTLIGEDHVSYDPDYHIEPGGPVGTFNVYNGKDGQGTVNSVMGIAPGGGTPNPFVASLDVPKAALMDYIHPVGSIYMTQLPISPASIFGGTWVLIHDKFLLAAGSSYAIDTFDGSATKSVSVEGQADVGMYDYNDQGTTRTYIQFNSKSASGTTLKFNTPTEYTRFERVAAYNYTGSDQSNATHVSASGSVSVMPPYRTVYVWLRTSPDYADYDKEVIVGKYVQTNATVDVHDYVGYGAYNTILIACSQGDQFTLTGTSSSGAQKNSLYAFVGADGNRIARSATDEVATNKLLTAPANAAYLVVNYKNSEPFSLVGGDATGE